jgi:hypothetical protein
VTWRKKKIMSRREFDLFCAAMTVIEQRMSGYVFPQVSLGEARTRVSMASVSQQATALRYSAHL